RILPFLAFFLVLTVACKSTQKAQQVLDPYMTFEQKFVDLGTVKVGETPGYVYKFTNTGKEDITIELVSGCECTDLEWPEGKTFKPGEGGEIKITFRSDKEEDRGILKKTIDILLFNEDPKTGYQIIKEIKYQLNLVD
ncbi:MAG: DUF1573 domain-containing protein, partial [Bacteroidota bacterium]